MIAAQLSFPSEEPSAAVDFAMPWSERARDCIDQLAASGEIFGCQDIQRLIGDPLEGRFETSIGEVLGAARAAKRIEYVGLARRDGEALIAFRGLA